ncbi:MAG: radical SAM protein [Pseudomonadota bacterium]
MKDHAHTATPSAPAVSEKFRDPEVTAQGAPRARVALEAPTTLWFNTGTLCNITCARCYIESSPRNDALVYLTAEEVAGFLAQIPERGWPVEEIGLTGGEPFMNPDIIDIAERALQAGHRLLILTNAMRPMMRPRSQEALIRLQARYGARMTLRISLDHYTAARHDQERGPGSFAQSVKGMAWLQAKGIAMSVAGRSLWTEEDATARAGYGALFQKHGFAIDAQDPAQTVLFPEMDLSVDVPEISTACWGILGTSPRDVMCATSRMVVKRKGAARPVVVACTLLPYDPRFELGETLAEAEGDVALNHPHCAQFCVLGGARCSA